jgi:hypothetical protein
VLTDQGYIHLRVTVEPAYSGRELISERFTRRRERLENEFRGLIGFLPSDQNIINITLSFIHFFEMTFHP